MLFAEVEYIYIKQSTKETTLKIAGMLLFFILVLCFIHHPKTLRNGIMKSNSG
jgi:hypothetical protein